ncbi:hypothetical protein CISIN_1g0438352mg, partial [Citrus sinensis]
VKIIS